VKVYEKEEERVYTIIRIAYVTKNTIEKHLKPKKPDIDTYNKSGI
jgi:hypothetical protein